MYTFTNKFCSVCLVFMYTHWLFLSSNWWKLHAVNMMTARMTINFYSSSFHSTLYIIIHTTVQFVIHQLVAPNASYKSFSWSWSVYLPVSCTNTILRHACFNVWIYKDMNFHGCMFIEMGMNQRWSCFIHCLYPHTMFSSSCIAWKTCSHKMHA